jgi:hypothetical protein
VSRFARALGLLLGLWPCLAFGQSTLLQGDAWTPNHVPMYVGAGQQQAVVGDSGPAGGGALGLGLSELLLQAQGTGTAPYSGQGTGPYGTIHCENDAPIDNATGYHYLCFSPNATIGGVQGAQIVYGATGAASPLPLQFCVNGTCYTPGGTIAGLLVGTTTIGSGINGDCLYDNAGVLGVTGCGGITINSSPITGGTSGRILYDNAATVGELSTTGSGNVVLATAPSISSLTVTTAFTATGLVTNADLAHAATTVNGQTCTLGATCTVTAVATSIDAGGATTITNGASNDILYQTSGGNVGEIATANSSVLVTSSGGVPSLATTLPSGLTAPSLTVTTAFTATGLVTLADVATQAPNTVLVNATSGTASPAAQSVSSCSAAADALIWTTNTGFGCNTAIAAPAGSLTGTTLASGVTASSLTSVGSLSSLTAGNTTLTGTLTAASLSTSGTIAGSICATSAGLVLYESGINCFAASAASITVGTTTVASGTNGRIEYNNSGVLGEYTITGTAGNVVMSGTPTIVTPSFTTGFTIGGAAASTNVVQGNGTNFVSTAIATVAQIYSGNAGTVLDSGNVFNSAGALVALSGTTSVSTNFNLGFNFSFTATTADNYTLNNPTNMKVGQTGCYFLTQPASGTLVTIAFGNQWYFAGGTAPALTATLGATDMLCYIVQTTSIVVGSMVNNIKA